MSETKTQIIREFAAFKHINDEDASLLLSFAKEKKFPANAPLLRAGQVCSHVYLIKTCQVDELHMDAPKKQLGTGAVIGVQEILEGIPMKSDYLISQEGIAFVIPGTALEELILLSPTLAAALMRSLND